MPTTSSTRSRGRLSFLSPSCPSAPCAAAATWALSSMAAAPSQSCTRHMAAACPPSPCWAASPRLPSRPCRASWQERLVCTRPRAWWAVATVPVTKRVAISRVTTVGPPVTVLRTASSRPWTSIGKDFWDVLKEP
uniref:Zinc finger CCHC-type containing 14 n=1 Tax=Rousettus aegyptiacus TaxID=9407 RepID=A0A7J8CN75_ROUAE|nr:zinc finger CCHC-type containing 14 [Rousettus aegyptiacus]